jgi:hypothetical protein
MSVWNEFTRIHKSRKEHKCAATGKIIPIGSSCWHYVGHWEGDFQNWYMSDEAKEFMDAHPELQDWDGFSCYDIGEAMREAEREGETNAG